MKKFLSLVLAAMMLLAMASVAMADDTFTITITGETGHTYEAYQIFAGDLSNNVLSNIVWGTGVTFEDGTAVSFDGKTYTTAAALAADMSGESDAQLLADLVAKKNEAGATPNLGDASGESDEVSTGVYKITGLPAGYYLIKDKDASVPDGSAYTKFIVKIVKNTEATPKTDKATHEKKVQENVKYQQNDGYGMAYNDVADYNIGDAVPFSLFSKVPDLTNFEKYEMTFHDTMSAGLTFNESSVKVYIGGNTTTPLTLGTDYTVTKPGTCGCTFEVKIINLVGKGYTKGAEIRVDFTATLNTNAVIGLDGNPNTSKLEFSNNPNDTTSTTETPEDTVIVFTYELDVTKVDGGNNALKLEGAEFVLMKGGSYAKLDKLYKEETVTDPETNEQTVVKTLVGYRFNSWVSGQADATTMVSDTNGFFKIVGLDDGTYKLKETKAPAGYNLLADPIEFTISAKTNNGQNWTNKVASDALLDDATTENLNDKLTIAVKGSTAVAGDPETGVVNMTVENNVGATLPETGGIGTTLFYLFGGLMTAGSALVLVVRRRADADEE